MSELAKAADIVLPGAAWVEKDAIYTNDQGKVQGASRAIAPPGEAMEDWEILVHVGRLLGLSLPYQTASDVRRAIATALARSLCRCRQGPVYPSGPGAQLAAGLQPLRTLEMGLPLSGPSSREGTQRPDGSGFLVHSPQAGGIAVRALIATVALLLVSSQVAVAQLQRITAELTPLVESDAAPGSPVRAALQVRIPDRFHVQSDAPRDPTLIPTVLTVDAPAGVKVAEVVFPTATEFEQIGQAQPLLVFEHEFTIGVQFDVADTAPTGRMEVPGRLRYQACDDRLCYPPVTTDVLWTLNVVKGGADGQAAHSDVFDRIAFGTGRAPGEAPIAGPVRPVTSSGDGGSALLDQFTVAASTGGYNGTEDFLQFIRNAEAGVKEPGLFEGRGPLAILFLVLLGGLALNLTPCVLPMIPINLAIIGAGAGNGSRARGFLLGGAYGGAMALVYGLLGVIVILTAGTFGTINASPWFNLAIAAIFVALALAMFDVFEIDLSRFSGSIGADASKRGSFALAFVMGAVAALLAGACVAPVVIQVVVFSSDMYARGTVAALALPFLLGVGMAVPWPLAGAGLTALPKPGAWMVRVKQAFGVLILATAAPTTDTWRTGCSQIDGSMHAKSRPALRKSSRPDGTRRLPKAWRRPNASRNRCSWTCGPPGARTAW